MGLQMKTLIALGVGVCALLWNGNVSLNKATSGVTSLVSTAEARTTSVNTRGRTACPEGPAAPRSAAG
jgi:hypothetical protein